MAVKQMTQFLKQVRTELSRVQWPPFSEFSGSVVVVLVLVVIFAIYLGAIDLLFAKFANYLFKIYTG